MGFMTLSIYILVILVLWGWGGGGVAGGGGLITQGSPLMHRLPTHTYHARTDQVVFFKLGPEPGGYLTWALNTHRQKKHTRLLTHTHTHTQEDFHCQPTLGRPLRFYAIIFGNDFSGDAGEKCTGETETSCSGCWHSQRAGGRLDWPLWASRSEQSSRGSCLTDGLLV